MGRSWLLFIFYDLNSLREIKIAYDWNITGSDRCTNRAHEELKKKLPYCKIKI